MIIEIGIGAVLLLWALGAIMLGIREARIKLQAVRKAQEALKRTRDENGKVA